MKINQVQIDQMLQRCSVRIDIDGTPAGSGFWINDETVLTCFHVIDGISNGTTLHVVWEGIAYSAKVCARHHDIDCAALLVTGSYAAPPRVHFDEHIALNDPLYAYGFPDDYPNGDSSTPTFEGHSDGGLLLKLKGAQIRPGMSGAALLNLATKGVCGIVKKTRDRSSDLGGRAVPISFVARRLSRLFIDNEQYHRENEGEWIRRFSVHANSKGESLAPKYSDVRSMELAERLKKLTTELRRSDDTGIASVLRQQILNVRRELRAGPQLCVGDILDCRFRLFEKLGEGGFGTVWKAFDEQFERMVAVKVLHNQFGPGSIQRERFERGVRYMQDLTHPNVVRLITDVEEDEGYTYYAMELYPKGSLSDAVKEEAWNLQSLQHVVRGVANALSYAHSKNIVHRDVSPQNILIGNDGSGVLADFDLVYSLETTGGTQAGRPIGRFIYSADEVLSGVQHIDARADVFSLAMCIIYCFRGENIQSRDTKQALRDAKVSSPLRRVLRKATRSLPSSRYESIHEFMVDFERCFISRRVILRRLLWIAGTEVTILTGLHIYKAAMLQQPTKGDDTASTSAEPLSPVESGTQSRDPTHDVDRERKMPSILFLPTTNWQEVALSRRDINTRNEEELHEYYLAFEEFRDIPDKSLPKAYALNPEDKIGYSFLERVYEDWAQFGNENFLPWNRAYIRFAELVLQTVRANQAFLYWDWHESGSIPKAFESYFSDPRRNARPTWGNRTKAELLAHSNFKAFSQALEHSHNEIHVAIGGHLANTYTTTKDPMFWSIAAGVDRIWAEWQARYGDDGPIGEMKSPFASDLRVGK